MWSPSRIAEQRAAKRRSASFMFLNLWPFAAIMVVLAGLFMLRIQPHSGYTHGVADLPRSQTAIKEPGARREDAIHVLVTRDGAIYFNDAQTPLGDLAPAIQKAVRDGAENKVYLSGDKHAKNGDVERVVEELRRAGITEISILTN
jgi:biopolymer transport protein TolR